MTASKPASEHPIMANKSCNLDQKGPQERRGQQESSSRDPHGSVQLQQQHSQAPPGLSFLLCAHLGALASEKLSSLPQLSQPAKGGACRGRADRAVLGGGLCSHCWPLRLILHTGSKGPLRGLQAVQVSPPCHQIWGLLPHFHGEAGGGAGSHLGASGPWSDEVSTLGHR